jgi:dCTP deaminase
MTFWSGEKLAERLPTLISAFNSTRIDCAAYTLCVGNEAFVTMDLPDVGKPTEGVKQMLSEGSQLRIAPGQFAFLATKEEVEIPNDAIAFISMKAGFKFRGLINVSGFHVDPGYKDRLTFGVYNAGPSPVVVESGAPMFLIWYADLDRSSTKIRASGAGKKIDATLISNMSGQVFSPIVLNKDVRDLRRDLGNAEVSLRNYVAIAIAVIGFGATALITMQREQSDIKSELTALKSERQKQGSQIAAPKVEPAPVSQFGSSPPSKPNPLPATEPGKVLKATPSQ